MASIATTARIRDDIRAVYALGFFSNVEAHCDQTAGGWNLIWEVVEKPLISEIKYEGNKKYKPKKLNEIIEYTGKERLFFSEDRINLFKNKIKTHYTEKSYPNTLLSWRQETGAEPGSTIVIFEIKEGARLPVKKIIFEGNTVIPDKALSKIIETKKSFWFIIKRHYDNDVVNKDLSNIEKFGYADIGYLDAKASVAPVIEENNGLTITFNIEEGEPYFIGDISIDGNTIFTDAELLQYLSLRPGDQYSIGTLSRDLLDMLNVYRGQGYLDSDISPKIDKDTLNHVVNINLLTTESPRKHLGKVEIQGVVTLEDGSIIPTEDDEFRTKKFIIEREIELDEGEPLDWTKVIESDRNLINLDFFKSRGLPMPGQTNLYPGFERVRIPSDPTTENLRLLLEEKETGMLTFGGGLSTAYGPSVFVTLTERNILGYGIRGSITGEIGELRNRLALDFYEPHLFNTDYSADWDIYYIDQEGYGGRRFDEQRTGSSLTIGKELNKDLSLLVGMKGEITDLNPDVGETYDLDPDSIPREFNLGENTTTSLSFGYYYDGRDFKVDPRNGIYSRSMIEVAGVTDNEFIKWKNTLNYFLPVFDRFVFALSSELNMAYAYGDPGFVPLQERFFAGGANSIRGFDEGGIGPSAILRYKNVDGGYRTYLGGEAAYIGNVELRYPITEMFQAVSFVDMGSVWPEIGDFDPSDFRYSAGAGIRVRIPGLNAMIRFDLAFPLRKFSEDDTEFFHFSFGQSF